VRSGGWACGWRAAEKCRPEWKMVDGKWKRAADYWRFTIFHLPFAIQEMRFSAVLLEPATREHSG
jgi:hypothetical protein